MPIWTELSSSAREAVAEQRALGLSKYLCRSCIGVCECREGKDDGLGIGAAAAVDVSRQQANRATFLLGVIRSKYVIAGVA